MVAFAWMLLEAWLFLVIGGVAGELDSRLYWAGMAIGPVALLAGSILHLNGRWPRNATVLVLIGGAILTALTIYNVFAITRRDPLEAPPAYWFYFVLVVVVLLADIAIVRVVRRMYLGIH
jgi:hypothetical protein